jgi:hypothetical protein
MTFAQMLTEIENLSVEERLKLLEVLSRSLQSDLRSRSQVRKVSALERVRGLLRPIEGHIPTDQELRNEISDYLENKHQ